MSIYATLWTLKFPLDGVGLPNCAWIRVTAQAVPPHVGSPSPGQGYEDGDPYAAFLPPAVEVGPEGDAPWIRAVVIVTERTQKGTAQSGQEYVDPLLVLTGRAYAETTFEDLHGQIRDALRARHAGASAERVAPTSWWFLLVSRRAACGRALGSAPAPPPSIHGPRALP